MVNVNIYEKNVLAIQVVLSNKDQIIFELDNSIYSCRTIINDEDTTIDETQIIIKDDSKSHFFGLDGYRKSDLFNGTEHNPTDIFSDGHLETFVVDDVQIFRIERPILSSSKIASYYLRSNEILRLKQTSSFIKNLIDYQDDLLFLYPDFTSSDSWKKSISSIEIKWVKEFTKAVSDNLRFIESEK